MSALPAIPPLDSTLGAIEIGGVVSTVLFGIVTLQAYYYFSNYQEDSVFLKSLVAAVWFCELGHTISIWHTLYAVTVTFYGQLQHLETPPRSLEMAVFFSACILVMVQSFFANRIRVLSKKWLIPVICWALAVSKGTTTMGIVAVEWVHPDVESIHVRLKWLMPLALSFGMMGDTVITASMCYCLWQVRHSTFTRTKRMVDILLIWTVETGLATCVISTVFFILFMTRNDMTWFALFLVQAKSYSNSLLASLNGRHRLREAGKILEMSSGPTTLGQNVSERNRGLVIEMKKIVETDTSMSKDLEHGRDF
ncbi:hypothetical protein C8R45DRAFT_1012060 [Mycena sanguinolenta]|nr:hypothetical protein C8R45DRAFT_1012060 [Mycena sanguinolenta]